MSPPLRPVYPALNCVTLTHHVYGNRNYVDSIPFRKCTLMYHLDQFTRVSFNGGGEGQKVL